MKKRVSLVQKVTDQIVDAELGVNINRTRPDPAVVDPKSRYVIIAETANRMLIKHSVEDTAPQTNETICDIIKQNGVVHQTIGPALRANIRARLGAIFPNIGEAFDAANIDNRAKLGRFLLKRLRPEYRDDNDTDLIYRQDFSSEWD